MATSLTSTSRMNPHFPTTQLGATTGAELVTLDGRSLPLVGTTLRAEAQGGIARLVLEQRFVNTYDETLQVTYRMPLPADGAVSGYAFEIAGRVVKGVVDRKQQARQRFEEAIASGRTAALLEQERSDIFTQKIGNIPAGENIIARITVDLRLVWLPEGEWELRFPTVIGPRYIGSADTINDARATHVKAATEDLGVRLQIELAIKDSISDGRKASSPTHKLAAQPDGSIALSTGTRLDRDLVVRWPVATAAVGISLAAARPTETPEAFGLLSIVPPASAAKVAPVPRDLLVLLDTSGSMGGGPLDKAKQVVSMLIDSLGEQDRLEMIEFSNEPRRYKAEPVLASAKAKAEAITWVRSRHADGGTEMREAVAEALQTLRIGAQRQVLIVTDGYVGGEQQILRVLYDRLPASCRLHVLGVGSAVNRSLATALARAGRGAEVIVGIDEDAERGAKRLLDRTRMPVLTNVEIAGTALLRHVPEHVPDVFEGAPLVAALELRPEGGELVVRGQLAHESWEQRIRVPATRVGDGNPAIAALFGRERVADLEARSAIEQVNAEIEAIGLRFQIATRLTSWVAIDERIGVEPGRTRDVVVPQELPYGTSAQAFGLRGRAAMLAGAATRTMAGMVSYAPVAFEDEEAGDFGEAEGAPSFEDIAPTGQTLTGGGGAPSAPKAGRVMPEGGEDAKKEAKDSLAADKPVFRGPAKVAAPEFKPRPVPSGFAPQSMAPPSPAPAQAEDTSRGGKLRTEQDAPTAVLPPMKRKRPASFYALLAALLAAVIAALLWWLFH